MSDIYLYTNDLELGTKLTNRLLQIEHSIRFLDTLITSFNKNSTAVSYTHLTLPTNREV